MTKLRPMRVNSNQMRRILRGEIGNGFLVYKYGEDTVEVAEFVLGPNKELLQPSGDPLEYCLKDEAVVTYQLVAIATNKATNRGGIK